MNVYLYLYAESKTSLNMDILPNNAQVVAIIQARMRSSRLPGKVMKGIIENPVIWHVLKRVQAARSVHEVTVASSLQPLDDVLEEFCSEYGVRCFRGDEEDVLDRFYQAAKLFRASVIVRITADCPLIDPNIIDKAIDVYLSGDYDYVSTAYPKATYPDGLDTEVFSFQALERAWRKAQLPSEREHVTPYIWKNEKGIFKTGNITYSPDLSDKRWTLDDKDDLQFIREVYNRLYQTNSIFHMGEVLELLKKHPELEAINSSSDRNAGYKRSLQEDKKIINGEETAITVAESLILFERAKRIIPSCTQTFSKGWTQYPFGVSPIFLKKADGCYVWDVDNIRYLDWPMALGPVLFGHNYPPVNEAVRRQLEKGVAFSLPHYKEVELAERLCEVIPCAEMVRFGKNGSDATSGAVRAARAYTGRDMVACCGYHGWQDWYIGTTTRNLGVPKAVSDLTVTFEYNNIWSVGKLFDEYHARIACLIMEPTGLVSPEDDFLENVNEIAHKNGSLVIYDECWTGFRWSLGGAQEYFDVTPDLACFGKALGNGFPISAVVGRHDLMEIFDEIFFSFTFGGDMIGITAGLAVLNELEKTEVIEHIWQLGKKLIDGLNKLIEEHKLGEFVHVEGYPPKTFVFFKDKNGEDDLVMKSVVQQEMIRRGFLYAGYHVISYSHTTSEIDKTLDAYDEVFSLLRDNCEPEALRKILKGEEVKPVFRQH